jgi:hypothetical protein
MPDLVYGCGPIDYRRTGVGITEINGREPGAART